jgi:hypothetical protein
MSKLFSHVGVSRLNGVIKARFANDSMRVKVLAKGGHTDIDLVELTAPMTKEDAIQKLIEMNFANGNVEIQAALEAEIGKRTSQPTPAKATKAKTAKAAPKSKATKSKDITLDTIMAKMPKKTVSKAEVAAQLADMEDAPF